MQTETQALLRPSLPLWILLSFLLVASSARPGAGSDTPGHLDLVALGFDPVEEPSTDLTIGSAEFAVASLAAQASDPDLAALLGNVEAFSLRQFTPPNDATLLAAQSLAASISTDGWLLVQAEAQGTRQVTVHIKLDGVMVGGLTIMALDPGREVSIANVVGNIPPQQLATLGLPIP